MARLRLRDENPNMPSSTVPLSGTALAASTRPPPAIPARGVENLGPVHAPHLAGAWLAHVEFLSAAAQFIG